MGSLSPRTPFGKPMLEHFLFDKNFRNLNHGSFGTYPLSVRDQLRHFQDLAEAQPDRFMRYQYREYLLASRTAVAGLLHVPVDTCVFVQNATLGVNTVLRNLVYQPGDVIVYFDTIYAACEKTIASILETDPHVQARKVDGYEFPCEHDEVVDSFLQAVKELQEKGLKPKVAVFDTICAMPGVRFPFERLTEECRRHGVLSCIDGAHGIGHIPLDLEKLDPDFFVSNCHKWLFTPRSCAVFYVPFRNQHLIRTTYPTSHGFVPLSTSSSSSSSSSSPPQTNLPIRNPLPPSPQHSTRFTTLFQFIATLDNAPYYCLPAALHFRTHLLPGEAAITTYLGTLAHQGGAAVAHILHTDLMTDKAGRLTDCAMTNIRLPIVVGEDPATSHVRPAEVGRVVEFIQNSCLDEFGTFVAVYGYKGRVWARLSAMVYLELADFEWVGREVLREICARVRDGKNFRVQDGEAEN